MKPKPDVTSEQLADFVTHVQSLVGKIPGLHSLKAAKPYPLTAYRAQGFSMGVIAVLDKPEDLQVYTDHPAHARYVYLDFILLVQISWSEQLRVDCGRQLGRFRRLICYARLHELGLKLYDDMLAYDMEFSE